MAGKEKNRHTLLTRRALIAGGGAAMALAVGSARAQSFPSGPVKIVVSVGPGSSPDVIGRVVADRILEHREHESTLAIETSLLPEEGEELAGQQHVRLEEPARPILHRRISGSSLHFRSL